MQSLPLEWSQGPHMISQHNKNMTTSRFDIPPPPHLLIILELHNSCAYGQNPCWFDIHFYIDCKWMS